MRLSRRTIVAALLLAAPAWAADLDGYANTGFSLDGIGKSYMGREIAAVMGFEGASWLDRASRDKEEASHKLVPLLGLKPTDVVADIGAGTGYFSFQLASAVPQGKVYAEDIQKEMLDVIRARKAKGEGANVIPLQGSIVDPKLPQNGIDLMLLVDVYHEFSFPREMGLAMVRELKPGGRLVLVEYRAEDPNVPIRDLHRMTEKQAKKEMAVLGLIWQRTDESLPWQHVMFFQKPAS
jgi:ubiquinone/menaquinone biosynthesis C-methylase UbiE